MKNKNKKSEEISGLFEYLRTLIAFNKGAAVALFILLAIIFALRGILHIPNGLLITLFVFTITVSVYVYLLSTKVHKLSDMENICMAYFMVNVLLYTLIVHYLGGIEGIGIIIYLFTIIEASILLPRRKALPIVLLTLISYSVLGFLEYFGIIPHHEFFLTGVKVYNNIRYLLFTIFLGAIFGFSYSSFIAGSFSNVYRKISNTLRKERTELVETQSQLKEAKETLEIKVESRTKELKELAENLEQQVEQRTEELQEKVQELERFQKFAVGRELKMVELKKKMRELEEEEEK